MKRASITRDESGVPCITASTHADLLWGLGYCHAQDRGMQMLLMRILGEGRASEHLDSSDATLQMDVFFRRMNWTAGNDADAAELPADTRTLMDAYVEGVNARFRERTPWEFKLLRYKPPPWRLEDCLLLAKMTGYLTLAQSQGEIERLFIELVQAGIPRAKLDELFPGILGGLDEELLRKVQLDEPVVPASVKWGCAAARMMASNNWAVSGAMTASGKPMLASDPHLEVNRLPNVWCEAVLQSPDRFSMGATMPGLPLILVGRSADLAWGPTYACMDAIDSWIEHCRDFCYRREVDGADQWLPFRKRCETILRKKKPPYQIVFWENDRGVLAGVPWKHEYCLVTRWSGSSSSAASFVHALKLWLAGTVEEGMECLGRVQSAFNWVLADRHGSIGYQMSGLMPKRREGVSGFVPLPGWKPENDWQGFVDYHDLPRCLNPPEGFIVTANQDLNALGNAKPINVPMAGYRARRIRDWLAGCSEKLTVRDFAAMHYDVHSPQAERFMPILRPLLPDTNAGRILAAWNCGYEPESEGAYLFERVYHALLKEVFAPGGLGPAFDFLAAETGTFIAFHRCFDRVIMAEDSAWFDGRPREEILRAAIAAGLSGPVRRWGDVQKLTMANILLGGKLPRFFGFDRGPVTIRGGRATVHQGQIYRSAGRTTSFIPSFRIIADMAELCAHTNMPGGPSDRRFSKWYNSGTVDWLNGIYKQLKAVQ